MPSAEHLNDHTVDPGADPDDSRSWYVAGTGYDTDLFDADNAFNRLNRYMMLWQVVMLWPKAWRFVFNRYRHWNLVFLRDDPGKPAVVLLSKEGTLQGDVFGRRSLQLA